MKRNSPLDRRPTGETALADPSGQAQPVFRPASAVSPALAGLE